jgi:predicted esterase
MKFHVYFRKVPGKYQGCVLILPGRGNNGAHFGAQYAAASSLDQTLFVGLTPPNLMWYPQPYGTGDQQEAIKGLKAARRAVKRMIYHIVSKFKIPPHRVALVGFSAGAVVALDVVAHMSSTLAGVVSHSGCILDPASMPPARCPQDVLLFNRNDDRVFLWDERVVPSLQALDQGNYAVQAWAEETGGHTVKPSEVARAAIYLAPKLGYPASWQHPEEIKKVKIAT